MSNEAMMEYERELKEPSGAKVPKPPVPKMDGVMISRECALVVELRDVGGLQFVISFSFSVHSRISERFNSVIRTEPMYSGEKLRHVRTPQLLPRPLPLCSQSIHPRRRLNRLPNLLHHARPNGEANGMDLQPRVHLQTLPMDIRRTSYY